MPKQNRVTPYGEIISTPERGMFMGNRGCLHNENQEIISFYKHQNWIICELEYKGNRRQLMTPNNYTELFFLDEATALSAGHRPCFQCRNKRAKEFFSFWTKANPELTENGKISSKLLDKHLHKERIVSNKQKMTFTYQFDQLPNGVFISLDDSPNKYYLKWQNQLLLWTPGGYKEKLSISSIKLVTVLTPKSIVKTIEQGFTPIIHSSFESI